MAGDFAQAVVENPDERHPVHIDRVDWFMREKIIAMRNMIVVDSSDSRRALAIWKKTRVKFTDCLIATQVPKGVALVTYDRDFAKLPGIIAKTPKDIVTASEKS